MARYRVHVYQRSVHHRCPSTLQKAAHTRAASLNSHTGLKDPQRSEWMPAVVQGRGAALVMAGAQTGVPRRLAQALTAGDRGGPSGHRTVSGSRAGLCCARAVVSGLGLCVHACVRSLDVNALTPAGLGSGSGVRPPRHGQGGLSLGDAAGAAPAQERRLHLPGARAQTGTIPQWWKRAVRPATSRRGVSVGTGTQRTEPWPLAVSSAAGKPCLPHVPARG